MTLRLRLGIAGGIVLLVLLISGLLLPQVVMSSQMQQVDQELASSLPQALAVVHGPPPPSAHGAPHLSSADQLSTIYVAIITSGARRVLLSHNSGGTEPRIPSRVTEIGRGRPQDQTVSSVDGGGRWRAVLITQKGSDSEVLAAISLRQVDATDGELRLALFGAGLAVLVVMAAVGWWLVRLGLKPIAEVTNVADAITAGDRSRRVRVSRSGTEASHLASAFNVMLDEQQAAEERLRRFVADASHELRTPITAIRGFTELWRGGALTYEGAVDDALRRIGQETERITTLVEDLLLLAHLDEGLSLESSPVDLSALARDAVLDASATHPSRTVISGIEDDVVTAGDEARLRQILANLVTNALVHTPDGSTVNVTVRTEGGCCVLEVADDGPGMDVASASHAFERFWRGDPGRRAPGSGLGLSIVKSIVAAHSGTIDLTTAPGLGVRVHVALPRYDGVLAGTGRVSQAPLPNQ
jgi:two-component system OmpR family sensor kinase